MTSAVTPSQRTDASASLVARASAVLPGGVSSPVRAYNAVGGTPRFLASGRGCRVTDVDGNTYVDYVASYGPLIAGHAHPDVVAAAREAADRGTTFGASAEAEVELAEEVIRRVPGAERVRFTSSGTEAAMDAVRLARGATGRRKVVKFAGHYHGHSDALLVSAGSGVATLGIPGTPGVTEGAAGDTLVVGWNDRDAVEAAFAAHGDDIALLACEPVGANTGVLPPADGFLPFLRDITDRHGALLLFDEVITGFRLAPGGAAERYGVTPDLYALGKVVGGGLPLAAFAGPARVMDQLAPDGPVYQAGTLSGNPVTAAAGRAQLGLLDAAAYESLEAKASALADGLTSALHESGVEHTVVRVGSLLSVFFAPGPIRDAAEAQTASGDRFARFFQGLLARGVHLAPSPFEALFVGLAHDDDALAFTVDAAREVAREL